MDTTDVNNAIENKKNQNNNSDGSSDTKTLDWGSFISSLAWTIIHVFIWLGLIGPIILYLCKLSQANVLPSDIEFIPYTNVRTPNIKSDIPIDINICKHKKQEYSTKLFFDQAAILKSYGVIEKLKTYQTDPKEANFYGNYWATIILNIIAFNFDIVNKTCKPISENLSETMILIISPIIWFVFLIGFYWLNLGLTLFYQFKYFKDWFAVKHVENNKVVWKEGNIFEFMRWLFLLPEIIVFWISIFVLPLITTPYTILSPLFIGGKVENKVPYSFLYFLVDNIYYKSNIVLIILSVLMISPVYKYLDSYYLIAFILAICILVYKHFYDEPPLDDDPLLTKGLASPSTKQSKEVEMKNMTKQTGGKLNKKSKKNKSV